MRYTIINKAFVSDSVDELGDEIPLDSVEEWRDISPETEFYDIDKLLFGYFKPDIANNIDMKSPLGISIFSRAVESIRRADMLNTQFMREYRMKETRLYVSETAVDGRLPYMEDDYYTKVVPTNADKLFFETFSPDIREENYIRGIEELKRQIEDDIGLARGTLSAPQLQAKTASEIKTSLQRTYVLCTGNQLRLSYALSNLAYGTRYKA